MGKTNGRRVFITGGGGGIGAVTGKLLAQRDWRVALLDRDGALAEKTAAAIGADRARGYAGDVTDIASVETALDDMVKAWGGIDDLINNAGIWDHDPLLDLTKARWQKVLDVNLLAPIEISNAAARRMKPGSAIVNVSSVLGQVSAPTRGPYCVSKSALISLTKMQAIEWAALGIRVNAIAPGYITNPTTLQLAASGSYDPSAIHKRTPMGRMGTEDEVAEGIAFLLSPGSAGYITGHTLEVNGGWTAYGFI
ncbi:SDR family NAD(P)-dependent oxidoreductase [Dongia sedimenti]|uniref:SDR family oxidoreductase n=1 Tax=Dongia sedimenti TaxID=3064282 RepID=A0ABU0YRU9_9PROT|nr:SDR family oxidoreductase [Rhodospirillaceae bacterium R-7]